jgi:acetoin utilization deacetylase AcuC-like enzyme
VKIFYTDHYVLPLPAGHRFPMAKYWLLRKCVEQARLAGAGVLSEPHAATDLDIEMPDGVGDADYLDALEQGICRALAAARRPTSLPAARQI